MSKNCQEAIVLRVRPQDFRSAQDYVAMRSTEMHPHRPIALVVSYQPFIEAEKKVALDITVRGEPWKSKRYSTLSLRANS